MSDESSTWPKEPVFYVEIEEHSEDGSWSGYAHTDEWRPFHATDQQKAILYGEYEKLAAENDRLQKEVANNRLDHEWPIVKECDRLAAENERLKVQVAKTFKDRADKADTITKLREGLEKIDLGPLEKWQQTIVANLLAEVKS